MFFVGVVGGLSFSCYSYTQTWLSRPVASVTIEGSFNFVSKQHLADTIYAQIDTSFSRLDLNKIQSGLENNEWIASARVVRRWPDILDVLIVEHQPIARWGRAKALNERGELIDVKDFDAVSEKLQGLPILNGPQGMEQTVMLQFQSVMQLFSNRDLNVIALETDASRSWNLMLEGGVKVKVGRHEFMEKLNRFLAIYDDKLKLRWNELKEADLRYFNGIAVHWNDRKLVKKNA